MSEVIPNQYIVVFKQHAPEDVCQQHCEWAQSTHTEASALRAESDGPELTGVGEQFNFENLSGYVASIDENLKNEIEAREEVDYVEPDYVVTASNTVVQKPVPSWGLARMSSNKKLANPLPKDMAYQYDSSAGSGCYGYIIDTGILITHVDFEGRASWGTNTVPGSSNTDKAGHGTHVAGTVGGKTYGMAKKCKLIAVKVLGDNGSGSTSGVIQGVQWSVNHAKSKGWIKKSCANMSLGGGKSLALNRAVAGAVKAGMVMCVAAGNDNKDAINYSPASEPLAYTIGSIDPNDTKSSYSNFGKCVDLFAPGRNITSCWIQPDNKGSNTISGTSMATPHVCGLALCLIACHPAKYPHPNSVTKAITALAAKNTRVVPPVPAGTTTLIGFNGQ
jgi:oryzin